MTGCAVLTDANYYDYWVVPHQLLPFMLTLFGLPRLVVLLLVYVWESAEFVMMNCFEWFEAEEIGDAILSDPLQGLIGVIVGTAFCYLLRLGPDRRGPSLMSLAGLAILSLPSLMFLDWMVDHDLHNFYWVPACYLALGILYLDMNMDQSRILAVLLLIVYISGVNVAVVQASDRNSFWVGTWVAGGVLVLMLAVRYRGVEYMNSVQPDDSFDAEQ